MQRLNLGCGFETPEEWENVDKVYSGHNIVADVLKGLPYEDDYFDFVVMNHTLQCFHYDELPIVLAEVKRVMKPGSELRILTPSLDKALEAYRTANYDYFPISDELETTIDSKFARYLFWHGDTRCAFNHNSLRELLHRNGFTKIVEGRFGECQLDTREEESLIMECTA